MVEQLEDDHGKMVGSLITDKLFPIRSKGGRISVQYWDEYVLICERYGISKSYEGFSDMVRTSNRINKVLFPLADRHHCDPMSFKNDVLDAVLCAFSAMEKNGMSGMMKKVVLDRNRELSTMDKRFKDEISNAIKKNMESFSEA
jgi:hypothetical protein